MTPMHETLTEAAAEAMHRAADITGQPLAKRFRRPNSRVDELARLIQASHQSGQRPIRRIRLVSRRYHNARGCDFENRISAERAAYRRTSFA